jgi:pimeloyl-ACP methyl ester carboxylesterase
VATGRRSTPATSSSTTGAADLRVRPRAIVLAIVAGVLLGVGLDIVRAGSPTFWLARHGWLAPYAAEGRLVDIGGHSLYIDCRGEGSPTIVFEAGAGGDAGGWGAVFPEATALTRACVYNRAGLHRSGPAPSTGRRTGAVIADDLARLLRASEERPPYVIVAHSLGGVYARIFADRYRADVAGIVLDDAFNPDLFGAQVAAAPLEVRDEWLADMAATFRRVESIEGIDWDGTATELAVASVNGLPLEIVAAPRRDPNLSDQQTAAIDAAWLTALESLSSDARVTVADGAGHFIHLTRPELIVDAIRRLVESD